VKFKPTSSPQSLETYSPVTVKPPETPPPMDLILANMMVKFFAHLTVATAEDDPRALQAMKELLSVFYWYNGITPDTPTDEEPPTTTEP